MAFSSSSSQSLPIELVDLICSYLTLPDLYTISQLNKLWYQVSLPCIYTSPIFTTCNQFSSFLNSLKLSSTSSTFEKQQNTHSKNVKKLYNNVGRLVKKVDLAIVPLRWNLITDKHLYQLIKYCPNVQDLNLPLCKLNSFSLSLITKAYNNQLVRLGVEGIKSNKSGFQSISSCKNLIYLDLTDTNIEDEELKQILIKCKSTLREISLENCELITDNSVQLLKQMPKLSFVNLANCYGILNTEPIGLWEDEAIEFEDI
ncbi:hypothetical protein K502DRAFT_55305 [Neoconidiobolus thromboides FSU 785]|nr:hypothetical protein K502DRAFT_55305 [Neoconidiobolus thromboides FSU 785]